MMLYNNEVFKGGHDMIGIYGVMIYHGDRTSVTS